MKKAFNIYVVDDDPAVRDSLRMLLKADGHEVKTFAGAGEFLDACTPDMRGCIILDVKMPGMDGPTMQEELKRRRVQMPIIFLSGEGSIPVTVRTIKTGAVDFLTKPVDGAVLLACVNDALKQYAFLRQQGYAHETLTSRIASLTDRQREIMLLSVAGHSCKEIARQLGISHRTVEIHRSHIMHKTGASNLVEIAHLVGAIESKKD
jgi:FixJ family two-component response regulator